MVTPVTIGVVARERFSTAARSLRRLLESTPTPFRLIIVDAGTPPRYRREMEQAVAGHPNVEFLRTSSYLNPNAAKNWVVRETREGDFLALLENDNLVSPGWLDALIRACEKEAADVARPLLYESRLFRVSPHFDTRWESIETIDGPDGPSYRFHPRTAPLSADLGAPRARTQVLETHCLLFRRSVFEKIGPFDERINCRQELDVALQLHAAGVPVVFEPSVAVTYLSPPPVHLDEREFFHARWDYETAVRSHEIIEAKWRTLNLPSSLDFAMYRPEFVSYPRYVRFRLHAKLSAIASRLRRRSR
jgi:GT2 family glycosyltransferase